MNVARFSVKNPVLVHMATLLVLVAGVEAYRVLPREEFQNVSTDRVQITTVYPGATADEVEKLITVPLEDEIADVDYIDEIQSISQKGRSTIWVKFEQGVPDMYRRVQDVQTEIDKVPDLPDDAETPTVQEIIVPFPVVTVGISGGVPELELKAIEEELERHILDIPGVEDLRIAGVRDREIWVEVDPQRMGGLGVSLADVRNAIRAKNLNLPAGKVALGRSELLVRTIGEATRPDDLSKVIVRSSADGGQVTIGDFTTIRDTFEEPQTLGRVNREPAITITVNKANSGDTIQIVKGVRALVAKLQPGMPAGVSLSVMNDASANVARRFESMEQNGLMGFVLVLLSLWAFIGFRAALMTAAGIPIAFLGAITLMQIFGVSFNMLSLFSLVMVLGMIVDDAIVVCENVYRHIEEGEKPLIAAVHGTQEVIGPVTASVTTTIAAFIPLMLFHGTMAKFLSTIPKVVIFALTASLVECFLALPLHLAEFAQQTEAGKSRRHRGWLRFVLDRYERLVGFVVRRRYVTVCVFLFGAVAFVFGAKSYLQFKLFPVDDIQYFDFSLSMPVGTPLNETEAVLAQFEDDVFKETTPKELENVSTTIGFRRGASLLGGRTATHLGMINVDLTDSDLGIRQRSGDEILEVLRQRAANIVGPVSFEFIREQHGPPTGKPVLVRVRGKDFAILREIVADLQSYMATIPSVVDVASSFEPGNEEIQVLVDEERAALYGIDVAMVADVVRTAVDGSIASTWYDAGEDVDIRVRYQEPFRASFEDIENLQIPARDGALVPFKNVARIERHRGLEFIDRYDRDRVVYVTASLEGTDKNITSKNINERLAAHYDDVGIRWPGYSMNFGGEFEETQNSLDDLRSQFIVAIILIYLILGATFRSFVQPLIVLCTVPFAFVGVLYGLIISNEPLGLMTTVGVIALAGIVVNDSIVMVHKINGYRAQGYDRIRAVVDGATHRLRPILLTSITTIFGLVPLAGEWFGREPMLNSMAIAIVWGLTFSTVLTLVVIPAVYTIFDDVSRSLGFNRFRAKKMEEEDAIAALEREGNEIPPTPAAALGGAEAEETLAGV